MLFSESIHPRRALLFTHQRYSKESFILHILLLFDYQQRRRRLFCRGTRFCRAGHSVARAVAAPAGIEVDPSHPRAERRLSQHDGRGTGRDDWGGNGHGCVLSASGVVVLC